MKEIKGLIFDSDGTIVSIEDYIPVFREAMFHALRLLSGNNRDRDEFFSEAYEPIRLPKHESDSFLKQKWGVEPEKYWKLVEELDYMKRMEHLDKIRPYPDTEILKDMKNRFRIGMLSNTPESIIRFQREKHGMSDIFESVMCSTYKCDLSKPGTRGLDRLLESMGLERDEVVYIGDADIDQELSLNAGIPFIHVDRNLRESYGFRYEPDFRINDFYQLEGVLYEMRVRQKGDILQKI